MTQETELGGFDDGCAPRTIGDAGTRALLLPDTSSAGAHSGGTALLLGSSNGDDRLSGDASLLFPHLAMVVRAEEVAREHAKLVQRREEDKL